MVSRDAASSHVQSVGSHFGKEFFRKGKGIKFLKCAGQQKKLRHSKDANFK